MTRPASWLASVLGLGSSPTKGDQASGGDNQPAVGTVADDMKEIRDHLRRVGAALGAAGGALLTGLGYTQVHKVFPLPTDSSIWLLVLAIAASFGALVGAATLAGRFYGAQRRILVSTEPDKADWWSRVRHRPDLLTRERKIRDHVYDQAARDESAQSLKAVELRANRYDRIARRGDPSKAEAREKESKRLLAAVEAALDDGALAVLERRAHQAFNGWLTRVALLATIAGIIGLFGLADWSQGQRDLLALGKTCVEAKQSIPKCKRFAASQTQAAGRSSWLNSFRTTVLRRPIVAFRVYGGDSRRTGLWFTRIRPTNAARARSLLALPEQNRARCVVRVEIPRGRTVRIGHAAPLFNQPGGGTQLEVEGSSKGIVFDGDKPLPPSRAACP